MTDFRFREPIGRRGLSFTDCDGSLRAIALGVCDYLAATASSPGQSSHLPLEASIIPVVESIFQEGAQNHSIKPDVDIALLATTAAWAVSSARRGAAVVPHARVDSR